MRTILLGAIAAIALGTGATAQSNQGGGGPGGQPPPMMSNPGAAGGDGQRIQGGADTPRATRPGGPGAGNAARRQPMDQGGQGEAGDRQRAADGERPRQADQDGKRQGQASDKSGEQRRKNNGQSAGRDGKDRPAAAGNVGSRTRITISTPQQKTVIRNNIVRTGVTIPAGVTIAVGSVLPSTIAFHPVPATIIAEIPTLEPYYYVVVDGQVVFVDPGTYQIVYVMPLA